MSRIAYIAKIASCSQTIFHALRFGQMCSWTHADQTVNRPERLAVASKHPSQVSQGRHLPQLCRERAATPTQLAAEACRPELLAASSAVLSRQPLSSASTH